MKKTMIKIQKMDCPSEIKMIEGMVEKIDQNIKIEFDLGNRIASFYHKDDCDLILHGLSRISLPGNVVSSEEISEKDIPDIAPSVEAKTLKYLLAINFTMFIVEIVIGHYAESTGLIADGLDMLADSFVYGLSLIAVGGTVLKKKRIAKYAGYFQITLAIIGIVEVIRRFLGYEALPVFSTMIIVSIFALIANGICLYLLQKSKSQEAHMRASMIFTSNDIVINLGVITAGVLVNWLHSGIPDLIIGIIVFGLVIQGAFRILKLSK